MIKQAFLRLVCQYPVAAVIKSVGYIDIALSSDVTLLFILKGDAFQLVPFVAQAHKCGEGVVVYFSQPNTQKLRNLQHNNVVLAFTTEKAFLIRIPRIEGASGSIFIYGYQ